MRLVQHKKEAYWFYRFLSIFYDKFVNPLFWTVPMRDKSLEMGQLEEKGISVVDVGSGTGFNTEGIVKKVPPQQVTCVDQSPHQMSKAKAKPELQGCTFLEGDAENLPLPSNSFDRYVSAGSIEYWPDPARGIREAYRVVKPGGLALMIGPLEPANPIGRFIAELWMLFPKEEEYWQWFRDAGFEDLQACYVKPQWVDGKGKYGIALAGRKPLTAGPVAEEVRQAGPEEPESMSIGRRFLLALRVIIGSLAGFLFIPAALIGYARITFSDQSHIPKDQRERLNHHQITAILVIITIVVLLFALLNQ
ncbi:MAG: methyltransferase domain-containing protein [Phaeodactylibacter sp.]|uniref:methyltransferase domain-containing protein n=1 Tax=Phaeodactylibacter sp. TaxID=1940289 RepID=UPI0032ED8344